MHILPVSSKPIILNNNKKQNSKISNTGFKGIPGERLIQMLSENPVITPDDFQAYISKQSPAELRDMLTSVCQKLHSMMHNKMSLTDGKQYVVDICKKLGIGCTQDEEDSMFILSYFKLPKMFDDKGINWGLFFENVKEIKNDAVLFNSSATSLGKVEKIGGNLDITYTKIQSLGGLKYVGGDANLSSPNLIDLGGLEHVGKWAILKNSSITDIGKLNFVGYGLRISPKQEETINGINNIQCTIEYW